MCFSAMASFVTAGVTGVIGLVSLTRARQGRERLLAATPIFFAVQQGIEGWLWLELPVSPDGPISSELTLAYLLFADVFWPVYTPLTVLLIEPGIWRRRLMLAGLAIGVCVAGYLLWRVLFHAHSALIVDGHIVYKTGSRYPVEIALLYLSATGLPLIASSRRTVVILGGIVLVGCTVAYAFYWQAFVSVWCFFAAAASVVILGHFEWARRYSARDPIEPLAASPSGR